MSNKQYQKLHILGAGPAGLAVGYYAKKNNIAIKLYESSDRVGGNCKTYKQGEYRFDTGAHRFHDKFDNVTAEIRNLLGNKLLKVNVPSKIFSNGSFIDFPLNLINLFNTLNFNSILKISYENIVESIKINDSPTNFKDLAYSKYGKTLSERFLINYTKKLWGKDPATLDTSIAGERLINLDLVSVLKKSLGINDSKRNLDGSFYYPKFGFGTIFDKVTNYINPENVKLNSPVKELLHEDGKIKQLVYGDNKVSNVKMVINSLPINLIIKMLNPSPPKNIIDIINSFEFRSLKLCICYLDLPRFSENASIYFPESIFPFTRIYEPKNRSRKMAPKEKTCIVIEIPFSDQDKIYSQPESAIFEHIISLLIGNKLIKKNKIIDYNFKNIQYAYPILDIAVEKKIDTVFSYLNTIKNMYHIGRNAEFQYLHTHKIFHKAEKLISQLV